MKKKIRAYDQLLQEEQQLEDALQLHQRNLGHKWQGLKESVQPAVIGMRLAQKAFTRSENNPVINSGVNLVVDLVVKKWLLKRAGWLTKLLIPYFVKNITSGVIHRKLLPGEKQSVS
jgi:hypothetical protein